jgi:hypothetical protein
MNTRLGLGLGLPNKTEHQDLRRRRRSVDRRRTTDPATRFLDGFVPVPDSTGGGEEDRREEKETGARVT